LPNIAVNIKMYLKRIECDDVDIDIIQRWTAYYCQCGSGRGPAVDRMLLMKCIRTWPSGGIHVTVDVHQGMVQWWTACH
jgi:methylaspartate ammonia-lyase